MNQQRHRSIFLTLALVAVVAIPPAAATWAGRGFYEPDTARDRTDGMMWTDPDVSGDQGIHQVYFNAFNVNSQTANTLNLGATHSSHIDWPYTSFYAIFGAWKDCNQDGYVGYTEGALFDYRAELLSDTSVCPPGQSIHNDGEWVRELIWLGVDGATDTQPANFVDDDSRVWGDIGLPEDSGVITCPLTPQPRGTYQSTGGAMRYVDCIVNYQLYNTVNLLAPLDDVTGMQISFDDAPRENPQFSESILNQRNPYGHEREDSYVNAVDCSGEGTAVEDPTGDGLRRFEVRDPTGALPTEVEDPAGGEPIALANDDGSIAAVNFTDDDHTLLTVRDTGSGAPDVDGSSPAGTLNETLEGSPHVGFRGVFVAGIGVTAANGVGGDCDRSDGGFGENADVYEAVETDFEPSTTTRRDHDLSFIFYEGSPASDEMQLLLGENTPDSLGLTPYRDLASTDSLWYSNTPYTVSRNPYVSTTDYQPQKAQPFTFYAYANPSNLSTYGLSGPAGAVTFTYGDEHCEGEAPETGLWDCDPENWWRDPTGADIKSFWQVRVGQQYNFRDIDCFDETYVEGQPETTTHLLTGTSCAR